MNDQMNAFIFLKNVSVNVFFLNKFERERERVHFLCIERERERIQFLSERSEHCSIVISPLLVCKNGFVAHTEN